MNIYDTKHIGNELDIFLYFNQPKLRSLCWLQIPFGSQFNQMYSKDLPFHLYLEKLKTESRLCFIAVAIHSTIEIISINHQKSIKKLCSFNKAIITMVQPYFKTEPFADLLVSASIDGIINLWHWPSGNLLHSINIQCKKLVSLHVLKLMARLLMFPFLLSVC